MIGLTNDDPAKTAPVYSSYTLCGQYNGSVAEGTNATVNCSPSSDKFRFVIVQSSFRTTIAICIAEVYVYERSECCRDVSYT